LEKNLNPLLKVNRSSVPLNKQQAEFKLVVDEIIKSIPAAEP